MFGKRKISAIMLLLIIFISFGTPIYAAKSVSEIEAEIEKLKAENAAAQETERISIENVKNIEDQLAQTLLNMEETRDQITVKNIEMEEKEAEIAATQVEIERIETEIPEKKEQAAEMLKVLQETNNSQFIVKILTDTSSDGFTNILRSIYSLNKVTKIASDKIEELVALRQQLDETNENLKLQKAQLEYEEVQLQEREIALGVEEENFKTLKKAQLYEADHASDEAAEAQQMIESNEQTLSFYKSQGCTGDQVFGVDCGPVGEGAAAPAGQFVRPMYNGTVTCEYKCYISERGNYHSGIDLSSSNSSEPIYPIANGYVTSVQLGYGGGYGNNIMIRHTLTDGTVVFSHYSHLSTVNVGVGEAVTTGTHIGNMGNTGNSTGPHLDLEIMIDTNGDGLPQNKPNLGESVDPRSYISFPGEWTFWYNQR